MNEDLQFNNVGDFGVGSITKQSKFLAELNIQQDQYQKIMKQLKTNKMMKNVLDNPETKAAFLNTLQALIEELDNNK
jgi:hypothetical protein